MVNPWAQTGIFSMCISKIRRILKRQKPTSSTKIIPEHIQQKLGDTTKIRLYLALRLWKRRKNFTSDITTEKTSSDPLPKWICLLSKIMLSEKTKERN